jgi:ABC-type cobalamin/Fe3+-siderophores transport system ATPase subunit
VYHLFTKGSHHRNISVILITHNFFHKGRYCRDVSLNAKYIVLIKNVRDKSQFSHLPRQVCPENIKTLYNVYLDAIQKHHSYFVLDLSQDTNDLLRYRTYIFPEENLSAIYGPVSDDMINETVQLS